MSAFSSKPSDDHNDGADRDIQTYQQFQNLLLFLSSTGLDSGTVSTCFHNIY